MQKKYKVKCTFKFESTDDWVPGEGACWIGCPFSVLIDFFFGGGDVDASRERFCVRF